MLISRRGFLIGAGSVLGSSLAHSAGSLAPATPTQPCYRLHWDHFHRAFAVGPTFLYWPQPQPSWRSFIASMSTLGSEEEFEFLLAQYGCAPEWLDDPVDVWKERSWDLGHDSFNGAYRILNRLDLGPVLDARDGRPCLEFHNYGYEYYQHKACCWAAIAHPIVLSLLQARLLELRLPIRLVVRTEAAVTMEVSELVQLYLTDTDARSPHLRQSDVWRPGPAKAKFESLGAYLRRYPSGTTWRTRRAPNVPTWEAMLQREATLAPYREIVDEYVLNFSDEIGRFPCAIATLPSLRCWITRFIGQYVLDHGELPRGRHQIDRGRWGGIGSPLDHDFTGLDRRDGGALKAEPRNWWRERGIFMQA